MDETKVHNEHWGNNKEFVPPRREIIGAFYSHQNKVVFNRSFGQHILVETRKTQQQDLLESAQEEDKHMTQRHYSLDHQSELHDDFTEQSLFF